MKYFITVLIALCFVGCTTLTITNVEQQKNAALLTLSKTQHLRVQQTLKVVGLQHAGGDQRKTLGKVRVEKILDSHRVIVTVLDGTPLGGMWTWVVD
jgi:hypothetical protein